MKGIKTLLLGLSFGVFLPFIGLAVCFIGIFMKDDSQ